MPWRLFPFHNLGFSDFIRIFQSFKEILIIVLLGVQVWTLKTRIRFHFIDYAVIAYFCYTFLYVLLPIGEQGFTGRLIAFKSSSFFPLIYFCGRLFDPRSIYINKYFHYILYVAIAAAVLVFFEFITDQHFQSLTGYSDYHFYFFEIDPSGNNGLTWTFETATGFKRFSSFFANPIELAAATLLTLAVIAALSTADSNKFKIDTLTTIAFIATQFSIILAISRSAFLSYFLMIYIYAWITKKNTSFILYISVF